MRGALSEADGVGRDNENGHDPPIMGTMGKERRRRETVNGESSEGEREEVRE
jgi:hypothetical protein